MGMSGAVLFFYDDFSLWRLLACTLGFFGFPNSDGALDFRFWLLPFWTLFLLGFRVYLIATLSSLVSYSKNNNIINSTEKSNVGNMFSILSAPASEILAYYLDLLKPVV